MSGSFFVHDLVAMGFDRARAEKAVLHTHNRGVEPAIQWLVDHGDDGDIDIPIDFASTSGQTHLDDPGTALGVAAGMQPVMGLPSDISHVLHPGGLRTPAMVLNVSADCKAAGEKTVVLAVDTAAELQQLSDRATSLSLATYTVRDAGRTEVAAGSVTVLAIGGITDFVDQVTGKLKTY